MTEISIPLDQLLNGSNGHLAIELDAARVDAARGVFITSKGDELELTGKQVNKLILERIINEGKPRIPMIEVTLLGKHKQLEPNANDPGYLALLEEWQSEQQIRVLRYLFVVGVKGQPPPDFVDEQRPFFASFSDVDAKYLWVSSMLPEGDIEAFTEALMGQTQPTAKGVEESANFTESPPTASP